MKVLRDFSSVSAILLFLIILVGCTSPSPAGYRTYSLEEGAGHLSFKHPSRIPVKTVQLGEDGNYTMIDLAGPISQTDRTRTRIWITITNNPDSPPDIQLYLQSGLGVAESLTDYRFMDRSKLTVAGEAAEQIIYTNTVHRSDYESRMLHLKPFAVINRQIYLMHGNTLWTISLTASERAYYDELPDFDHMLATFTFLD